MSPEPKVEDSFGGSQVLHNHVDDASTAVTIAIFITPESYQVGAEHRVSWDPKSEATFRQSFFRSSHQIQIMSVHHNTMHAFAGYSLLYMLCYLSVRCISGVLSLRRVARACRCGPRNIDKSSERDAFRVEDFLGSHSTRDESGMF